MVGFHVSTKTAAAKKSKVAKGNGSVAKRAETITIPAPNFKVATFWIRGTSPLVGNKFSKRALDDMRQKQEAGHASKKGEKRDAKDFQRAYQEATHRSAEGWAGIPAAAFRNAMISACRVCGFAMTRAKLSVFVIADGYDPDDGSPLVRVTKGEPEYAEHYVRNESGVCDLRPRPMWQPGWEARVRIRFDSDQFTMKDVANLLARAGIQVGICAGRPDSAKSNGMGWGLWEILEKN